MCSASLPRVVRCCRRLKTDPLAAAQPVQQLAKPGINTRPLQTGQPNVPVPAAEAIRLAALRQALDTALTALNAA